MDLTIQYLLVGLIIGGVMGLTGAGGALVAIPLFMQLLGMELKVAAGLSLVAVVLASLLNLVPQWRSAQVRLAIVLVLASLVGSTASLPLKALLPEWGISSLLTAVALYALYALWFPRKAGPSQITASVKIHPAIGLGLILGVLTTLTGLGGGVLLMPLLVGVFALPARQAVATSLLVVALSSLYSFVLQMWRGALPAPGLNFVWLALGIVLSALGLTQLAQRLPPSVLDLLRKIIFSFVALYALTKIWRILR